MTRRSPFTAISSSSLALLLLCFAIHVVSSTTTTKTEAALTTSSSTTALTATNKQQFSMNLMSFRCARELKNALKSNKYVFVIYYAPWCEYSKKFIGFGDYHSYASDVADRLVQEGVVTGIIDADMNSSLDIDAYPTLRLYINQQEYEYKDKRTVPEITNWVVAKLNGQPEPKKNPPRFASLKLKEFCYGSEKPADYNTAKEDCDS